MCFVYASAVCGFWFCLGRSLGRCRATRATSTSNGFQNGAFKGFLGGCLEGFLERSYKGLGFESLKTLSPENDFDVYPDPLINSL